MNERFYFRHVIRASHNGPVAKSRSMLNIAIFDPWQRSLFSLQRTPGKEPLLAGTVTVTTRCKKESEVESSFSPASEI